MSYLGHWTWTIASSAAAPDDERAWHEVVFHRIPSGMVTVASTWIGSPRPFTPSTVRVNPPLHTFEALDAHMRAEGWEFSATRSSPATARFRNLRW